MAWYHEFSGFEHSGITHVVLFDGISHSNPPDNEKGADSRPSILQEFKENLKDPQAHRNLSVNGREVTIQKSHERAKLPPQVYHIKGPEVSQKQPIISWSRFLDFTRMLKSKDSHFRYMDQIRKGYEAISRNYVIDEVLRERDYILLFADKEGAIAATAVANIINMVGVIEDWDFERNYSLVYDLAFGSRYNDENRLVFRKLRTQFARVDLICVLSDSECIPVSYPSGMFIGKTVILNRDFCQHCGKTGAIACYPEHKIDELLFEYENALPPSPSPALIRRLHAGLMDKYAGPSRDAPVDPADTESPRSQSRALTKSVSSEGGVMSPTESTRALTKAGVPDVVYPDFTEEDMLPDNKEI